MTFIYVLLDLRKEFVKLCKLERKAYDLREQIEDVIECIQLIELAGNIGLIGLLIVFS